MSTGLLHPILAREHTRWREEVSGALEPSRRRDAGPWGRWHALHYLEHTFPGRVERERRLVRSVEERLTGAQRAELWALGELLEVLPAYLSHLVGLCHRAGEFAEVTARVLEALGRWCRATEEALGPLPASAVPAELLEQVDGSGREMATRVS